MKTKHTVTKIDPSESALAADEFATWIRANSRKLKVRENYEIRPCVRVRGFMLRLPGIGWKLWFPTVAEALSFTQRVASIHQAECLVFDAAGQRAS
ncbi:MAG: hypothetical protein WCF18_18760 [Chthoniobacteraceae bacterium]